MDFLNKILDNDITQILNGNRFLNFLIFILLNNSHALCLIGLNSEFSFSKTSWNTKVKEPSLFKFLLRLGRE